MATEEPVLNIVNKTMLDAGLTKIADAIRAKGGTTAQLAFPDGMADAIAAIEAGGGMEIEITRITFADDIACKSEETIELCETEISTPGLIGLVAYNENTGKYMPIVSFGLKPETFGYSWNATSAYACGNSSYNYSSTGYINAYSRQSSYFNTDFANCLRIKDGKVLWRQKYPFSVYGTTGATFYANAIFYVCVIGV